MPYAILWSAILFLLALWSLTAWGLHAVGAWSLTHAGDLGGAAAGIADLRLPEWLSIWVPAEVLQVLPAFLSDMEPFVQALLQAAPVLAGGFTVLAWVVWAFGSAILVGAGVAGHLAVATWRSRRGPTIPAPQRTTPVYSIDPRNT